MLEAAKALAPVDTGALRDAIRISVVKPKTGDAVVVVGLRISGRGINQARVAAAAFGEGQFRQTPPSRRWHFIELGTSELAAHPFLRPALDTNAAAVTALLMEELVKAIAAATRKKGTR